MMARQTWRLTLLLMAVVMAMGCGQGPVALDAVELDPEAWFASDTVKMNFTVDHPEHRHDLQFGLRHDERYPFSNLYLFVRLNYPNGKTLTDTLECPLASPSGEWYGDGSRWIDHRIGYKRGVAFPLAGEYSLEVVHAMRMDPLPGMAELRFAMFDKTAP